MNFFNSIFSDDPEPSNSSISPSNDPSDTVSENPNAENPNLIPEFPSSTISQNSDSVWSFGSLIKNITTQSESVIGNYRREFEEFGSGLLKETSLIRDVASRAVQELPDSIDSGAAVAQESLETVGQAIDNLGSSVWQNTTKILARGKELHLFDDDDDVGTDNNGDANSSRSNERNLNVKRYSWFDTRMREIQGDPRTYTEEPHDLEDYKKWSTEFNLDEKCEEIENLIQEERMVERIYLELVPVTVDRESFWSRYFYKGDKLKQAEEARARIMKRAISREEDDEDLSWDVDDDDVAADKVPSANVSVESTSEFKDTQERSLNQEEVECKNVAEITEVNDDAQEGRCNEGKVSGEKNDSYDSSKDSDLSIISTQPSLPGEEELEWDELGDLGSDDGNKITASSNSKLSDLRSRLTGADEEEDLSWDIEDEEEPMES